MSTLLGLDDHLISVVRKLNECVEPCTDFFICMYNFTSVSPSCIFVNRLNDKKVRPVPIPV